MLYLFNSAYRPKYAINLLNTLFLEEGSANEYRYSYSGETVNVDPEITNHKGKLADTQVMIVFIDCFHKSGFFFHPLRLATYLEHELLGDQAFFRVKLGDFIYPRKPDEFQHAFCQKLGVGKLPHPTNDDPERKAQGFFALIGDSVFNEKQSYRGDEAWSLGADALAKAQAFAKAKPIFIRASIWTRERNRKRVFPKLIATRSHYGLLRGKRYTLQLYYRFPLQDTDRLATDELLVRHPSLLSPIGPSTIEINSRNCLEYFEFAVKNFPEDRHGTLTLAHGDEAGSRSAPRVEEPASAEKTPREKGGSGLSEKAIVQQTLLPNSSLTVSISESASFWGSALLALLCYAILGVLVTVDLDKIAPPFAGAQLSEIGKVLDGALIAVQRHWVFAKCIAASLQGLVLFSLFRLFGTKIL